MKRTSTENRTKRLRYFSLLLLCAICVIMALIVYIFQHYYNMLDVHAEEPVVENQEEIDNNSASITKEELDELNNEMITEEELEELNRTPISQEEQEAQKKPVSGQDSEVKQEPVKEPVVDQKINEKTMNIMLLGMDSRENNFEGRTDAMILLSINPESKKAVMTSFLRDMYVSIPGHGGNRLNTAYMYGGTNLLSKTISNNFGIDVDNYVIVNIWMAIDLIDAFGGVEIDITAEEIEVMNGYVIEHNQILNRPEDTDILTAEDAGVRLLNGSQAIGYARNRYVGTDFGRTSRQREVIYALVNKMKGMSVSEINSLLETFLPRVRTNLSQKDLTSLLLMALDVKNYTIESMAIPVDNTWRYANVRGMSVLQVDYKANAKAWYEKVK